MTPRLRALVIASLPAAMGLTVLLAPAVHAQTDLCGLMPAWEGTWSRSVAQPVCSSKDLGPYRSLSIHEFRTIDAARAAYLGPHAFPVTPLDSGDEAWEAWTTERVIAYGTQSQVGTKRTYHRAIRRSTCVLSGNADPDGADEVIRLLDAALANIDAALSTPGSPCLPQSLTGGSPASSTEGTNPRNIVDGGDGGDRTNWTELVSDIVIVGIVTGIGVMATGILVSLINGLAAGAMTGAGADARPTLTDAYGHVWEPNDQGEYWDWAKERWVTRAELSQLEFPPADAELIHRLTDER